MLDDHQPEAEQSQIIEGLLLQDASDGQPDAIRELISRYAAEVYQLTAYVHPTQDRIFDAVTKIFADVLNQSGDEHIDESLGLMLARAVIQVCQEFWEEEPFDRELLKFLQALDPISRFAWLLVNASILPAAKIADILKVDQDGLSVLVSGAAAQLEAAGIDQPEINSFLQARRTVGAWDVQDAHHLADILISRMEEEKRRQRIRLITLEIIWAFLGVAILIFGFQIFNSIGVTPGGGSAGFETQTITTVLPELTEIPENTPVPTRTPLPYESTQANAPSFSPAISGDGLSIVFASAATNLVVNDTNELSDVFLYNRLTREISLVPVGIDGSQANGPSSGASISADGNFIVFTSWAENLIPETNSRCITDTGFERACAQVYGFDRETGDIQLISQSESVPGNGDSGVNPGFVNPVEFTAVSADGNVVAFFSLAENLGADPVFGGLFIAVRDTGELIRVDRSYDGMPVNGSSYWPSLSADGRFLAFATQASNLVDDDLNNAADIYVYDRDLDVSVRITTGPTGTGANGASMQPAISNDGRWLAFRSEADDLVEGDFNHTADVFLHDLRNGITALVSATNQAVSADRASNLPSPSGDGAFVGFISQATDLDEGSFNGTWDLYIYAQDSRQVKLASIGFDGRAATGPSSWPDLSEGGEMIVFVSAADNLVDNDVNGVDDIFLDQREAGLITRINLPPSGLGN
jgi:Tol biopolymer transport system component